ncbi:hypothetical protein [Deinococcus rufus]|uniref:Uncharacterized protein n=1 Tax=Deinococcus rufus TaxID=2136097 RepID=A0ABV7Z7R6_9DEIO
MSVWLEVRHHAEDGPEPPERPAFTRRGTHTARTPHRCEVCEGWIRPGERSGYEARLDDEERRVVTVKAHEDVQTCDAERARVEAWRVER